MELTLLDIEQIIGHKQLDIFKKIDYSCPTTDFCSLLGGSTGYSEGHINAWFWTKSSSIDTGIPEPINVNARGYDHWEYSNVRYNSIRPVVKYSSFSFMATNKRINKQGVLEVNFGEYPQSCVDKSLEDILQHEYLKDKLKKTGKTYTIDSILNEYNKTPFTPLKIEEMKYNEKKFIRLKASKDSLINCLLDNSKIDLNKSYWIQVEPITWLVDEMEDIAVCKNALVSGIQFDEKGEYEGDFENTFMYKYLNEYLIKDIIPSKITYISNPYNFDFSDVSEEDILRGCIESNTAVMLHGESGDGKSARVKELDKDAVVVYMLTQGLDSFAGKSVLINNELVDIPPTWYTKLKHICESEPDKLHIVFFDEIANAPPSVQAMAFNVILEHEINGKWKLPKNARVVAAMNEMTESRSSYGLSEPLYNRFAHVYIKTNPNDWLKWAISEESDYEKLEYKEEIKRKIHPSIYAYISYKGDALRTKYTGISPNADPRKWEMASKVLYTTNNPNMIRSLVGEEITVDFINFCTSKVITIEDVLTGNYTDEDLELTTSEKYNTVVALSKVDIEHFEIIREFTKKLGSEMVSLLDTLWATSIEKLEILQEITLSEKVKA